MKNEHILSEYMPEEEYLHPAWCGCLHWALGTEEIVDRFREDTGNLWKPGETVIERMIDESTGADKEFICAFAQWMNENIWGSIESDEK